MTGVLCTISPQNGLVPGADFVRWNGAFGSPPEVQKYFERLAIPRLLDLPGPRTKPRTSKISDDEWLAFAREVGYEFVGLSYVKTAEQVLLPFLLRSSKRRSSVGSPAASARFVPIWINMVPAPSAKARRDRIVG